MLAAAAGMKHHSFKSIGEAAAWIRDHVKWMDRGYDVDSLINLARSAKNPFQFISDCFNLNEVTGNPPYNIPLSMDASSSAYQIMSYFTFNIKLAVGTNLIKLQSNNPDELHDLYNSLLEEFKDKMADLLDNDHKLADAVRNRLSRKLMKKIYMPLGKTKDSATADIKSELGDKISGKDAYKLADAFYKLWKERFPDVQNLMNLVNEVGWFAGYRKEPIIYSKKYFTTVQDYIKTKIEKITVYNKALKKRHTVSLSVPTDLKDRAKSKRARDICQFHSPKRCRISL